MRIPLSSQPQPETALAKSRVTKLLFRWRKVRIIWRFLLWCFEEIRETEDVPWKLEENISRKARLWVQLYSFPPLWTPKIDSHQRQRKEVQLQSRTVVQNPAGKLASKKRYNIIQPRTAERKESPRPFRQAVAFLRLQAWCTWSRRIHDSGQMVKEELQCQIPKEMIALLFVIIVIIVITVIYNHGYRNNIQWWRKEQESLCLFGRNCLQSWFHT